MAHLAHYREAHPLPFVITHWVNMVCMMLLILSGCLIHWPFIPGVMGIARGTHIFCGCLIIINLIVRIVLAFVVKSAPTGGTRQVDTDYKVWFPQRDNRHQLIPWIKYYLFIKKDHPLGAKYGVPQKMAYWLIIPALLFMGYTGFCLWGVTAGFPIFAAFTALVGGAMKVRIIHYFMMFFFICFVFIHVYLANIEGFAPTKLMFARKEAGGLTYDVKTMHIDGKDDLGESEGKKQEAQTG
ncbi:MAG: cytochrome b/b6 domain-containing protein [Coriobacteriaceae bacterium]|nr:cytochrome b/b6 domain-containing protein [Coriobacteriaceae bacterium]